MRSRPEVGSTVVDFPIQEEGEKPGPRSGMRQSAAPATEYQAGELTETAAAWRIIDPDSTR